ncbi:methyltransferase type 11 [Botryosphaeria dothidea]|uniref:Methyltransferase type 11 n=1 Tax=Botryosphaeria dothidea TaxID=55169 RepID=A0A8H4J5Z3_9PEZI|nr:methyltransferase type 11 [Botryosphaeria dothidea]
MSPPAEDPAPQHIEAEDDADETNFSYESDLPSNSSLSSTITNYEHENGRRYHGYKKGTYFAPNDEDESDRLDLVLRNDLSPIQPSFLPPNVRFEIDDIEDDWTYTEKFDFIHARYLLGAIKDWPALIQKCYKYLKPGGWIELQDFTMQVYSTDGSLKKDSYLTRYLEETLAGMSSIGNK